MSLTLAGTGALTLPSGTTLSASPATGDRSTAVMTTQKLADEFGVLLAGNGYQKLPSGLIIQWGSSTNIGNATNVTFPLAWPNGMMGMSMIGQSGNFAARGPLLTYATVTKTSFYWGAEVAGAVVTTASTVAMTWLAIGY